MSQDATTGSEPLRWLLVDEYDPGSRPPDRIVGSCAEVDGLFDGPAPLPASEPFTLTGCAPGGALRGALDGSGERWLPCVLLDVVHDPGKPPPPGCQRWGEGCSCTQELFDVRVLGARPSPAGPGLVDIDVLAHLRIPPERGWPDPHPPDVAGFLLTGDGGPLGACLGTTGIFRERVRPPVRRAVLRGLRPEPWFAARLTGPGTAVPGISAEIRVVERNGDVVGTGCLVFGRPVRAVPSSLGPGLVDVTLDDGVEEPLPAAARAIWDLWYAGGPDHLGGWTGYDRCLRRAWVGAAMYHRRHPRPDRPAGAMFHLDGRFVTDVEGFYCALGEAVNGPGGYFGGNLAAVQDCLCGGWGVMPPFRLVWHDADVARQHLVPGFDRPPDDLRLWGPAVTLDDLLRLLAGCGVDVELR